MTRASLPPQTASDPALGGAFPCISVIEADPAERFRLAALIAGAGGFRCQAAYPDAETALREIPLDPPDLVLLDLDVPDLSGLECLRRLRHLVPRLRIVVRTRRQDPDSVVAALKAGADGYLLKHAGPAEVIESLAEAIRGGAPMAREATRWVLQVLPRP